VRITLFRGLRINLIRTSKDVVSHIIPALHIRAAVFFSAHQQRRIDLNSLSTHIQFRNADKSRLTGVFIPTLADAIS